MLDRQRYPQPHPDVASITIDGETFVVLEDGLVEVLNQLGTRVWTLSDGLHSLGEIMETLAIVVLNVFTNTINALVKTEVDFPAAPELE